MGMLLGLLSGDRQNRAGGSTWQSGALPQVEPCLLLVQWVEQWGPVTQFPSSGSSSRKCLLSTCCIGLLS